MRPPVSPVFARGTRLLASIQPQAWDHCRNAIPRWGDAPRVSLHPWSGGLFRTLSGAGVSALPGSEDVACNPRPCRRCVEWRAWTSFARRPSSLGSESQGWSSDIAPLSLSSEPLFRSYPNTCGCTHQHDQALRLQPFGLLLLLIFLFGAIICPVNRLRLAQERGVRFLPVFNIRRISFIFETM